LRVLVVLVLWLCEGGKTGPQKTSWKQNCAGRAVMHCLWITAQCRAASCQGWTAGRHRPSAAWAPETSL